MQSVSKQERHCRRLRVHGVAASRHDLTDPPWAVLAPLLPPPTGRGCPRRYPLRGFGRRCALPGAGGVSVAGRSGPVRAVVAGVCTVRLLAGAGGVGTDRVRADRRRGRAGQAVLAGVSGLDHCPGARVRRRGQAGQREAGCRRTQPPCAGPLPGGWSTKTHLAVDQRRGVISFLLTPARPTTHADDRRAGAHPGDAPRRSPGPYPSGPGSDRQGLPRR
jgi:hypothetical protein